MTPNTAPGVWREGAPAGHRRRVTIGEVALESGSELPDVSVAYQTWGELAPDGSNAVLVLHALTGDSHVTGDAGEGHPTPGWWGTVVGPGCAIDTDRWFVVAPNVLGGCQGTTGPSTLAPDGRPWASRFPRITVRDQVEVERRFSDAIGVERWAAVVGGSMGGMRVLEWAAMFPDRVAAIAPIAVGAVSSADQIAIQSIQIRAIRSDPAFGDGDYLADPDAPRPDAGLALARRLAHWSYRSREELDGRFGRDPQPDEPHPDEGGRYAVESYLDHHGSKLVHRFDAASYVVLTEAMNGHDVGRGRGGVATALAGYDGEVEVIGVSSDRLYPVDEQHELARHLIAPDAHATIVTSPYGHDGFLIEHERVGAALRSLLARVAR